MAGVGTLQAFFLADPTPGDGGNRASVLILKVALGLG
jgi:hypothetical protein